MGRRPAGQMNLVFIQKSTGRGGAKNSLSESLRAISTQADMRASCLVGEPGPFVTRCRDREIPCTETSLPEWRKFIQRLQFPTAMRRVAAGLQPSAPDWIISNEMWWAPHAAAIASQLGCRSAVILRDGIATVKKSLQYRLQDHDLILPVSSTIADALRPHPLLSPKVHVLFNSVSVPPTDADDVAELAKKLSPYPSVRRWLLVVGKLGARKNQAAAVEVLRALSDEGHDDLGLLLAGDIDPDYRPEMDAAIARSGLADRIAMIGNFDGLGALLDLADTILLPSFREGLPRSLVEAITAGKPAFSFPCEGVADIYGKHSDLFVSRENTASAMHATISAAWADPSRTAAAFSEVRSHVLETFSPQAHLARLRTLIGA